MLNFIWRLFHGPSEEEVEQLKDKILDLEVINRDLADKLDATECKVEEWIEAYELMKEERDIHKRANQKNRMRIYRAKNYIQDWAGESIEEMLKDKETWEFELKVLDILDGKQNKAR